MGFRTSKQMIFFPNKRKISLARLSLIVAITGVTCMVFLAGVHVGVQNASLISDTTPLLTAELAAISR